MNINFELAHLLGHESGFDPPAKLSIAERVEIVNKKRIIEDIKKAMNMRSRYFSHLKKHYTNDAFKVSLNPLNFEELKGLNYSKIQIIGFNIFEDNNLNESLQINLKKYKVKLQKLDPVREIHSYAISFEYKECPDYKLWIFVNDTETLEILQNAWFLNKEDINIHRSWLEEFRNNQKNPDILDWLYLHAPIRIMRFVGVDQMLNDLTNLLGHSVDTFGTDEETAVTRLLQALYKEIEFFENYEKQQGRSSKNHNDEFLNQLISRKYTNSFAEFKNGSGREVDLNLLESLSARLDGDNYKAFLQFIWGIWRSSTYAEFNPVLNPYINVSKNNKGIDTIGPMSLGYRSSKSMGFHKDNAIIERDGNNKIKVDINIKTGVFDYTTVDIPGVDGGSTTLSAEREVNHIYMYHYFSPIAILNAGNPTFIFKDKEQEKKEFTFLPAFILLERDKKAFWENIVLGAEYTVDLITTFSGFANILKVGRLAKILKAGYSLRYKTKAATKTLKTIKNFAGVVELSSGVGNILIKLIGIRDTELGRAISKYLFYFEMLSLSGELTFALDVALKKSAKEVLDKVDDSKKGLDGIVIDDNGVKRKLSDTEIEEVLGHLKETLGYNGKRFARKVSTKLDDADPIIKQFETTHRSSIYEGALIYNPKIKKGDFHTSNLSSTILFPKRFLVKMRNAIVTHNHPRGFGLSITDIKTLLKTDMKEIRAVTPNGEVFSMRNLGIKSLLRQRYLDEINEIQTKFAKKMAHSKMNLKKFSI